MIESRRGGFAMIVALASAGCGGGDKEAGSPAPSASESTFTPVKVRIVAESVPKGMVEGKGYTATINAIIEGKPGTYLTFYDAEGRHPDTKQIDASGKASYSYEYNNMGSPEPGLLIAYEKPLAKDDLVIKGRIDGKKLPGAVASQRTMHYGGAFTGSFEVQPGYKYTTSVDFGEFKLDGKVVPPATRGPGQGELDVRFDTREGLVDLPYTSGLQVMIERTKGPITIRASMEMGDEYDKITEWMEEKGLAGGARFAGESATPPPKPRAGIRIEARDRWRKYHVIGKPKPTFGEIDVLAFVNGSRRDGATCRYGGGHQMILSEFDVTATLRWRVNGEVFKTKQFKPAKKTRCPPSIRVGEQSGMFIGSDGGLPSSAASVADAVAWIDSQFQE